MASQSVARSESFAAFIPELERLITEAMDSGRFRASPLRWCKTARWRSSGPMAFPMSKPA
jgi:hypothetical protein